MSNYTARNFCFTAYDMKELMALINCDRTKYLIYGNERCPTTNKLHFQGYLEVDQPMRPTGFKKLGAPTTHFEYRKGTQEQAIEYCKKEGDFTEYGVRKTQGERTDINKLKEDLDKGDHMLEISNNHFSAFLKYNKSMKEYVTLHTQSRNWMTNVEVHIGGPGSGKSHYCKVNFPNAYWMLRPANGSAFFDGYENQDTIILDDFYGWLPWDLLLRLADKYPLRLHTKGGSVECVIKNLIITSNKGVASWYTNILDINPLIRRISLYKDDYVTNQFVDEAKFKDIKDRIISRAIADS